MKKLIIMLVALVLSSSAFADRYVRQGPGYHHHQNVGREIVEVAVAATVGVTVLAVGGRVAQEILGTPTPQVTTVIITTCDRNRFVRGGVIYQDDCDGRGPYAVGVIGRR